MNVISVSGIFIIVMRGSEGCTAMVIRRAGDE